MEWLRRLAVAAGPALVDVHADADHHRSVFTLAEVEPEGTIEGARALAATVADDGSLVGHEGVHPRLGALDVVPFVAIGGGTEQAEAVDAARQFGQWWAAEFAVPVFFYDAADPMARSLPSVRADAFEQRHPDFGPPRPHPRLGATAVGARKPLIACNCVLLSDDVTVARRIAHEVRERDGGLPGVRALGFALREPCWAQVSINLVDLDRIGLEATVERVRFLARRFGTEVAALELVGLLPRAEFERCSEAFLAWAGIDRSATVEARVGEGPRWWPGDPVPGCGPATGS